MTDNTRLPFELDTKIDDTLTTAHAGTPLLAELFRVTGGAKIADDRLRRKERKRGLSSSEIIESLIVLWAAGGDRCEDLAHLREDEALATMLGHDIPAPQTARDFLESFHEEELPLWFAGEKAQVREESRGVATLGAINRAVLEYLNERSPETTATLDVDATVIASTKRSAKMTYEGTKGYQPVVAVWAEQDAVVYDEFRDGNVPAGAGNRHVVERSLANLPPGVEKVLLRADSALYDDEVMDYLDEKGVGYVISADMSPELRRAVLALSEDAWALAAEEVDAVRQWAEVVYVPQEQGTIHKYTPCTRRYYAIRILKRQGTLFADGTDRKHFAVVTNREGEGRDLIEWHRQKAGTVEHAHDVLVNELAAWALPSQKFCVNAAWFRMNVLLYNLLSILRRVALPGDLRNARPKRLRFLLLNIVGRVIRHARETLCRVASEFGRTVYDTARVIFHAPRRDLAGV
jgi:hypothetical protein